MLCAASDPLSNLSVSSPSYLCVYEVHAKRAKADLIKQLKALEGKNDLLERILDALSADEQVSAIIQRLKNGDTYDSIVKWLDPAPTRKQVNQPHDVVDPGFGSEYEMRRGVRQRLVNKV
jgi:hypothetical protein